MGILFVSCDGRTGYLDEGQLSTISLLSDSEWLMSYYNPGYGDEYEFDDDTRIYKFEKTGKGWIASGSFSDASQKEEVSYFQWTFTTENFSVIYLAGHVVEGYWLIEKLTPNELWVQEAAQDPVIYPNQDKRYYKFKARK
ncbi:MAG: hypothetical protein HDR88_00830 [Bacteroides sp.]|nr:hypothetical protein [Bacteroides sp.]